MLCSICDKNEPQFLIAGGKKRFSQKKVMDLTVIKQSHSLGHKEILVFVISGFVSFSAHNHK